MVASVHTGLLLFYICHLFNDAANAPYSLVFRSVIRLVVELFSQAEKPETCKSCPTASRRLVSCQKSVFSAVVSSNPLISERLHRKRMSWKGGLGSNHWMAESHPHKIAHDFSKTSFLFLKGWFNHESVSC